MASYHYPFSPATPQDYCESSTPTYYDDEEDMSWCPLATRLDIPNDMTIQYAIPVQNEWAWQMTTTSPSLQTPLDQSYCITNPNHRLPNGSQDYYPAHGVGIPYQATQWPVSTTIAQHVSTLPTSNQHCYTPDSCAGAERPTQDESMTHMRNPLLHPWPDVFESTRSEPKDPPVHAAGDGQQPQRKARRSPEDLYTPQWVRYHGTKREGWCGWCSMWFTLRDSTYWYHMHYSHGISQVEGKRLPSPAGFKKFCDSTELQVKCGKCNTWMALPKGDRWNTAYFRHTYKCHFKAGMKQDDSSSVLSSPTSKTRSPPTRLASGSF